MYQLFKNHHILPSQFVKYGYGEKQIISAFMSYELDEMERDTKYLKGKGVF